MLDDLVTAYLRKFPGEYGDLALLIEQIAYEEALNDRRNFNGHITGSGIVLSPDKTKILLIHHKLFNRWQQPGGHWENGAEASPLEAARREVEEETGIKVAGYLPFDSKLPLVPLDIDSHAVPPRSEKDEPTHYHHDFRYVFIAKDIELTPQEAEVNDAAWFALDAPETQQVSATIAKLNLP